MRERSASAVHFVGLEERQATHQVNTKGTLPGHDLILIQMCAKVQYEPGGEIDPFGVQSSEKHLNSDRQKRMPIQSQAGIDVLTKNRSSR